MAEDIFMQLCFMCCGLLGGIVILSMTVSGSAAMMAPPNAPPSGLPPRGTWPRRAGIVTVLDQYERVVKVRLGKISAQVNPGLRVRIPVIDEFVLVDIRDRPENIPNQVCISRDNVSIKVDGVVYWKVFEPVTAVRTIADPAQVIRNATMANLRVVIGEFTLDQLLQKRELIANRLEEFLDDFSRPLGIDITRVDVTDVVIPHDMQRAMAREAEAQRERRARLIRAQGEVEAVKNLGHAAHTLAQNPELLELRRLQTVGELGMEQSTLITLVLPYDYGNLGGGGNNRKETYTVEDNEAFLESIGVTDADAIQLEVAEVEVPAAPAAPAAPAPVAALPPAPAAPAPAAPPAPAMPQMPPPAPTGDGGLPQMDPLEDL